jgi:hypothetical protein
MRETRREMLLQAAKLRLDRARQDFLDAEARRRSISASKFIGRVAAATRLPNTERQLSTFSRSALLRLPFSKPHSGKLGQVAVKCARLSSSATRCCSITLPAPSYR